jgi:hypothetical protein
MNKALHLLEEYDMVFFFEDDILVSKYYLRLLRTCAEQHPDIMGMFNGTFGKPKQSRDMGLMVKAHKPRSWGFYLTRSVKDRFIGAWKDRYHPEKRTPYYDVIFTQTAKKRLKGKYFSKIARAKSIGIDGILSTNEKSWRHRNLHNQPDIIEFDSDKNIGKFFLR